MTTLVGLCSYTTVFPILIARTNVILCDMSKAHSAFLSNGTVIPQCPFCNVSLYSYPIVEESDCLSTKLIFSYLQRNVKCSSLAA